MYFYISIIITCKIYEEWNNDTYDYCKHGLQYAQLTQSYSTEEYCNGEMKIKLGRTLGKHLRNPTLAVVCQSNQYGRVHYSTNTLHHGIKISYTHILRKTDTHRTAIFPHIFNRCTLLDEKKHRCKENQHFEKK
jgi:hypothetical protein